MSRLTKDEILQFQNTICSGGRILGKQLSTRVMNELLEYKNIEKELGIDLITLFKALKSQTFYSKHPTTNKICEIILRTFYYCCNEWNIGCYSLEYNVIDKKCDSWDVNPKDYGKTWALTRKELKK